MRTGLVAPHAANRLGLHYRSQADALPWPGGIIDGHVHLSGLDAVRRYFEVAAWFQVHEAWTQTQLEEVDALQAAFAGRLRFIAVPNYGATDRDHAFGVDWYRRLEAFYAKGARLAKFWAAPRGRDFHPSFRLDHPARRALIRHAAQMGYALMVHVADPDTWFATKYRWSGFYGTKAEHYEPLEALLAEYRHLPVLAAHLAGHPEDLAHLDALLARHPNLFLDTSATKWMAREWSKRPDDLRAFLQRHPGRVMFGTDLVVNAKDDPATAGDHYASRFWTLRTLLETDHHGPSPITDPDLHMVDPKLPPDSAPMLHGCALDATTLAFVYQTTARRLAAWIDQRG